MQTASAALTDALKNGYVLKATPRLIVEWNQNRYAGISKVDNDPAEAVSGADIENYPIESIVEPQRPTRGIIKGRASTMRNLPSNWSRQRPIVMGEEGFTAEDFAEAPGARRYYTTGPGAGYKYWTSPAPSTSVLTGGGYPFPVGKEVRPYVLYKTSCKTNKIVVKFETTWARPATYSIQTTANGGTSWTTVSSNVVPDSNGVVTLYRQASGTWGTTVHRGNIATINGIRLLVTDINKPEAQFNLIELSARLESDLSEYLTSYSTDFNVSETNFITPIGEASSNQANFGLANFDGLFNNDNASSVYYKLIDKNALCTLDIIYDLGGGVTEAIREATMYVDNWSGTNDIELNASLKDSSKFLQETKALPLVLENVTVGEAIWRICDSVGFLNFEYEKKDDEPVSTLPYFWTDPEKSVWETLQELAKATQTAIYFDEFDMLKIKTREAAYDMTRATNWALEATNNGGKLADVEEANIVADYEANVVNINYKETKVSDNNKGFPEMHVLWEPEGDFVLRSSQLTASITESSTTIRMHPKEVATWPFEGMMNIEGELVKYDAKQYVYYNKTGGTTTVWVESNDQKINIDKTLSDENNVFKNTWTGNVRVKERGVYWSSPRPHTVDLGGWGGRTVPRNGLATTAYNGGIYHDKDNSVMRVTSPRVFGADSLYTVTRGQPADANYRRYGTRIKIPKVGGGRGGAGIVINSGDYDSGYYIELVQSEVLAANGGALRNFIHELGFFARHPNGTHNRLIGPGRPLMVAPDVWYDLDVDFYEEAGGAHNIIIYVNGVNRLKIRLESGRVVKSGRCGVYQRGPGAAEFEYFFAHAGGEEYRTDEVSQYDKTRGGYVSGQWDREYVYGTRDANRRVGRTNTTYKQKYNQYFMDEFGPIAHEIREMDLVFEKYPVLHSRLYVTNESKVVVPEYNANAYGAKFLIANSARDNAIVNGEDTLSFGNENAVTQKMMIYGRLIFQEEGQVYTAKNAKGVEVNPFQDEDSIRRRGKVEVDFDTKWVQSKSEAERLGNWILKHWSGGNDEVEATVFGNPLFQLGDVVTLDYPDKNMSRTTHQYFIVAISNEFSQGLSTSLTLRRRKT